MAKGKYKEQKEAKLLRLQGFSLKDICEKLGVSKGSASRWVRDVELSEAQIEKLNSRNPSNRGSQVVKEKALKKRMEHQREGRRRVAKGDIGFISGCSLYWGDGSKDRNSVRMTNCDFNLIRFHVEFIKNSFSVTSEDLKVEVNAYSSSGLADDDIIKHWRTAGLSNASFNVRFDTDKRVGSGKKNKYPYGVCSVSLHKTEIAGQIIGGIKELGGIKENEWIL